MSNTTEAHARIKINNMLTDAGWYLISEPDKGIRANVDLEYTTKINRNDKFKAGALDYLLFDSKGFPLCVLEAKREDINPLSAKKQARDYAEAQGIRFVILSNGNVHYLWDIEIGNPEIITSMPTQSSLEDRKGFKPNTASLFEEEITLEYVALMKNPNLLNEPEYKDENKRKKYCYDNGYRLLRPYQINAIRALQKSANEGNNRFLFEMATGTGKTLTSAAIIKLFLKTGNAKRVLFLVDRLELEDQADKNFKDYLKDYNHVVYKQNRKDWKKAEVVITTIQSLLVNNRYKEAFSPTDFDLLISDEAHRCIGGNSRAVFEYFIGYKLGLTATPKDYLKNVSEKKLKYEDPKSLERRILLDTYKTFGCENGEPTFRFSLTDGVPEYLVSPTVVDARTDITTDLLSEKGYSIMTFNEDGEEEETKVFKKDFEKKFTSEKTNIEFCKAFLQHGLKDPISGEFGKSIVFCVSQDHCSKITQILNQMAHKIWEGKYKSDFAEQVTSNVKDAQQSTINFSENRLNDISQFIEGYKTSKTRVCVTVGMMTTGYDCEDILNLGLMRPIFSPTDFVQIKGRGTRKHTFEHKDAYKNVTEVEKGTFKLFDFFANCEYFEKDFKYNDAIELPPIAGGTGTGGEPPVELNNIEIFDKDTLKTLTETPVNKEGMRIDREFFGRAQRTITEDAEIKEAVNADDWDRAVSVARNKFENNPEAPITLDKIQRAEQLDRRLSWREVLEKMFGFIDKFKDANTLLEDECDKFISIEKPDPKYIPYIKGFIKAYATDAYFRGVIDEKRLQDLFTYQGFTFEEYQALNGYSQTLPQYIRDNINIKIYA